MKNLICKTDNSYAGLAARVVLAAILWPHGAQKLPGWFGGYGFNGTMHYFTDTVHLPWLLGFIVILIEFFGTILLFLGIGTRIWAALIFILMLGVLVTSHAGNGFFMNWYGIMKSEGYEFDLLMAGLALVTFFTGGGKWSIDRKLMTT